MEKSGRAGIQTLGGQSNSGYRFRVVVVCDGDESRQCVLDRLQKVTLPWLDDFIFEVRLWRLQVFVREPAGLALEDLAAADLLILAMDDVERLDEDIRNRLQLAFQQMPRQGAAVATLTRSGAATSPHFIFLHRAAQAAGIEFIYPAATPSSRTPSKNSTPDFDEVQQLDGKAHILCLDDDASVRMICEAALTRCGYHVDTAGDGAAGWAAVTDRKYDLLITDNDMPGLTGVELVRKMRLAQMTVPVVLMSGVVGGVLVDEASRCDRTTILPKPFTPQQLRATVDQALSQREV